MKKFALVLGILSALLVAAAAQGGGWATVELGKLPADLGPGAIWKARMTVLQHGRTPVGGVRPTLTVTAATGERVTFVARPTATTGVYVADVRLPSAGRWSIEVWDGFTQYGGARTHRLGSVEVTPAPGGSVEVTPAPGGSVEAASVPGGSFPTWQLVGALLGALALGAAVFAALRRRAPQPAPQI